MHTHTHSETGSQADLLLSVGLLWSLTQHEAREAAFDVQHPDFKLHTSLPCMQHLFIDTKALLALRTLLMLKPMIAPLRPA